MLLFSCDLVNVDFISYFEAVDFGISSGLRVVGFKSSLNARLSLLGVQLEVYRLMSYLNALVLLSNILRNDNLFKLLNQAVLCLFGFLVNSDFFRYHFEAVFSFFNFSVEIDLLWFNNEALGDLIDNWLKLKVLRNDFQTSLLLDSLRNNGVLFWFSCNAFSLYN